MHPLVLFALILAAFGWLFASLRARNHMDDFATVTPDDPDIAVKNDEIQSFLRYERRRLWLTLLWPAYYLTVAKRAQTETRPL